MFDTKLFREKLTNDESKHLFDYYIECLEIDGMPEIQILHFLDRLRKLDKKISESKQMLPE